jgi:type I restriction enzyme, S subunit
MSSQQTFQDLIATELLEIGDGYRAKNSELGGDGPVFLRAGHLTDTGFDFADTERFRTELWPLVRGKLARPGDTVVTTKGNSTGRTGYVGEDLPTFVYSPHLSYWRSRRPDQLLPRFLRYWARGPEFLEQLEGMKTSTDMAPYLSLTDQRRLKITLPSPSSQRAIASTLTAMDDKIELNRRMNRSLEALASALFKSWFVDFDPATAKRDGKTPVGVPADAVDLFPSHFEDSAVGPIPKGWTVSTIGSEVTVVGGSTPSTAELRYWNGEICWITPRDLSRLRDPVVLDSERHITAEGLEQIGSGLLPKRTVLLSSRAPVGYLAISEVSVAVNQGFIAMKCDKALSPYFVLNWTRENLDEVLSRAGGTTFAEISKSAFRPIPVVLPGAEVLGCFDEIARPLHEQLVSNVKESQTLESLRDVLLPPLLSGELTVRAAEKTVAEVV